MISFKILGLVASALLPMSFAAPAPVPLTISAATAAIDWTPVDFNGKTIYINSAVLAPSSINPTTKAARDLTERGSPDSDTCGYSTINSHPQPFANTADCVVIRDWAGTQNSYWGVWSNTVDTHGILYYGTCVFEAGTTNVWTTWIGSTDIRDLTRDAINKWGTTGLLASQGEMLCDSAASFSSVTRWTIKHS